MNEPLSLTCVNLCGKPVLVYNFQSQLSDDFNSNFNAGKESNIAHMFYKRIINTWGIIFI